MVFMSNEHDCEIADIDPKHCLSQAHHDSAGKTAAFFPTSESNNVHKFKEVRGGRPF
jgi:hypothetical protein